MVGRELGVDPDCLAVELSDRGKGFVYLARQANPDACRARAPTRGSQHRHVRGGAPHIPAAIGRLARARRCGRGQLRTRRSRAVARRGARWPVRARSHRPRPVRARDRGAVAAAELLAATSISRSTGRCRHRPRAYCGETVSKWGARAASAIVLDPQTGECWRWRLRRASTRTASAGCPSTAHATEPSPTVRAGLDLQARDGRGRLSSAWSRRRRRSRCRTSCMSPTGSSTTRTRARPSACRGADPLALVERRDSHARAPARPGRHPALGQPLRLRPATGIDFPGESPGIVLPLGELVGIDDRNVPIGQGIARHADPDGLGLRGDRERGVLVQPHVVERVAGGPRTRAEAAACRLGGRGRDAQDPPPGRRRRGRHGHRGGHPRLRRGREDRHRAEARPEGGYSDSNTWPRLWASCRRRTRGSSSSYVDEPTGLDLGRRRRGAGVPADRTFALQYLECRRTPRSTPARSRDGSVTRSSRRGCTRPHVNRSQRPVMASRDGSGPLRPRR